MMNIFLILRERYSYGGIIMEGLQKSALLLTIIGAINWLLVGLLDFNLVTALFGEGNIIGRILYIIIGIAGLINIGILFTKWK